MPYVITTKRGTYSTSHGWHHDPVSRRAVATLEEARTIAIEAATPFQRTDKYAPSYVQLRRAENLPEQGGTVGPLPDGTVIEVEQRQWYQLAEDVGWDFHKDADRSETELLDAYNARQA